MTDLGLWQSSGYPEQVTGTTVAVQSKRVIAVTQMYDEVPVELHDARCFIVLVGDKVPECKLAACMTSST